MDDVRKDRYNHQALEHKWQKVWADVGVDTTTIASAKKPFYNLMMFPYPSAEGLHVGNMYAFTGADIYGRFKRMQGYDVFEPIGLDGFGIHSENYALKIGRHPMDHAALTEKHFYDQLHQIGAMFDFTRTLETYDPDYYRWTQWLFTELFKAGLAYRKKADVNFCPSCKTVLADEQVLPGEKEGSLGICERCGNEVEKRLLEQWFFKITAYAGKLLDGISDLKWAEKVKIAQTNWIGKKEGISITYPVMTEDGTTVGEVTCFTTRPDTNFGATFVVLAPEHQSVQNLVLDSPFVSESIKKDIHNYQQSTKHKSDQDRIAQGKQKTGVWTGLYCLNQLNNYKMPLYISDFVLAGFGTGAVVGVPGHDIRDFQFSQVFGVPIVRVVVSTDGNRLPITLEEDVQEDDGIMMNSEFLDGLDIHEATTKMMDYLEEKGWGKRMTTYHLRDWLISRQRYWGPPIPMIYCETCFAAGKGEQPSMPGWYTVPEKDLPVMLPRIDDYKPSVDGVAPLSKHKEFFDTVCPSCGNHAVRETDVSDTFLDSSWYFLRYPSVLTASAGEKPFDSEVTKTWLPVHMYTGGAEHSVLHLLYSRYITMVLHDRGYLDFDEPFTNFFAHGLIIKDGAKMSKSKGNVVNPDEYIAKFGADAIRLYLMFIGPFAQGGDFRDTGMEGMARWVGRVSRMIDMSIEKHQTTSIDIKKHLEKTIAKLTDDMEKRRYNTAIASLMEFTNTVIDEGGSLGTEELKTFVLLLAPFAPHLTEEAWNRLHGREIYTRSEDSVHRQQWPIYDSTVLENEDVQIVVQVNGKLRDTMTISPKAAADQSIVEEQARNSTNVQTFLKGKTILKTIFVRGRLINFVVR
jgi:leucyl-tRNA synthetase